MIIFLYGSDGYRLKENVDTVVGAYQKKHNKSGMNLYRFDFEWDKNYGDFETSLKSVSFFNEVKLIVIKGAFDNKNYFPNIVSLAKNLKMDTAKDTVLLFKENKNKQYLRKTNKELFDFLNNKNNLVKEIEPLSGIKLSNWVKSKFKENGNDVSTVFAGLLVSAAGNESWALANEINKLSNYKRACGELCRTGGTITEKDIELLVSRKEYNNIFDLVDAIGNQNKAKAFEMIYRLTNSGHDPHYLLSMLVYHFENLLSVSGLSERSGSARLTTGGSAKSLDRELGAERLATSDFASTHSVAKKCGLHPFVAKKSISQASKFTKDDLVAKFSFLAGLDVVSKGGQVDLEDALYNFTLVGEQN